MVFFPDKARFELRSPLFWEKPERQVLYYSIFHDELAYITNILKIAKTIDRSCVMCQSQARNFCSGMKHQTNRRFINSLRVAGPSHAR